MFTDSFLVTKPEIVALGVVVCGLTIMEEHVPGLRREGAVYPGFLNIFDHNKCKLGLPIIKSLGKSLTASAILVRGT